LYSINNGETDEQATFKLLLEAINQHPRGSKIPAVHPQVDNRKFTVSQLQSTFTPPPTHNLSSGVRSINPVHFDFPPAHEYQKYI
jgi:hypothetical protein